MRREEGCRQILRFVGKAPIVFFLIQCGQKNNYFGHAALIIRGDKSPTFHRPKSPLKIRRKFDHHRTKLEEKKITQFFLFNIFIFYFHYLSIFFFFFFFFILSSIFFLFSSNFSISTNVSSCI